MEEYTHSWEMGSTQATIANLAYNTTQGWTGDDVLCLW